MAVYNYASAAGRQHRGRKQNHAADFTGWIVSFRHVDAERCLANAASDRTGVIHAMKANKPAYGYFNGFSIVGGHEYAETTTDPFPSTGWVDGAGAENGDKCAWISSGQGAAQNVTLSGGASYPVQSLWSNAFNGGAGGCVVSYP